MMGDEASDLDKWPMPDRGLGHSSRSKCRLAGRGLGNMKIATGVNTGHA